MNHLDEILTTNLQKESSAKHEAKSNLKKKQFHNIVYPIGYFKMISLFSGCHVFETLS